MTTLRRPYYAAGDCALADVSSSPNVVRSYLLGISQILLGVLTGTNGTTGAPPGGALFTHQRSCNSLAVSGGANLWITIADVVRGTGGAVRSWFCGKSNDNFMRNGQPVYFCVAYDTGNDSQYSLVMARHPFTGGSTTARATSISEFFYENACTMSDVTAAAHRLHWVTDANGSGTIKLSRNGIVHTALSFLAFDDPDATDEYPFCMVYTSIASGRGAGSASEQILSAAGKDGAAGVHMRSPTGDQVASSSANAGIISVRQSGWYDRTQKNSGSGLQDVLPCPVYFYGNTGPALATRGTLPDWSQCNSASPVGGFELSDDLVPVRERVYWGNLLTPCGSYQLHF